MKICVDAGHGGRDPGAVVGDVNEKDIALTYSRELATSLRELGYDVLLTRQTDVFVSLSERVRLANRWGADCFISVHANANSKAAANGLWVIHDDDTKPEAGVALAHAVFRRMAKIPGLADNDSEAEVFPDKTGWVADRELTVVSDTKMPAILVELGFMTNPDDLAQLLEEETALKVADAIAVGITDWWHDTVIPAPVTPPDELRWPEPRFFYKEVAPVMLDVDLGQLPAAQADGLRVGIMKFLHRNVTEENTDWVIEQVRPALPWSSVSAWLLDKLLPDVVLDIIGRLLGHRINGG